MLDLDVRTCSFDGDRQICQWFIRLNSYKCGMMEIRCWKRSHRAGLTGMIETGRRGCAVQPMQDIASTTLRGSGLCLLGDALCYRGCVPVECRSTVVDE